MRKAQAAKTPAVDRSVFEKAEELSDVTFEVEGRSLHFWKACICVTSPFFERMFNAEFKEKGSRVIPLPGKKLKEVDVFLQNMHPAYAWKFLEDDETLEILLRFGDEYQVDHIRQKCLHYLTQQIQSLEKYYAHNEDNHKKVLLYFFLCERFQLQELRNRLVSLASYIRLTDLETLDLYNQLSVQSKLDIVKDRCRLFERKNSGFLY